MLGTTAVSKHHCVVWCKPYFDISKRLGVDHQCDGQTTDERTDGRIAIAIAASNTLDALQNCFNHLDLINTIRAVYMGQKHATARAEIPVYTTKLRRLRPTRARAHASIIQHGP